MPTSSRRFDNRAFGFFRINLPLLAVGLRADVGIRPYAKGLLLSRTWEVPISKSAYFSSFPVPDGPGC